MKLLIPQEFNFLDLPFQQYKGTATTSWIDHVSVTGSGFVLIAFTNGPRATTSVRYIIDGVTKSDYLLGAIDTNISSNAPLAGIMRFNSSLKIQFLGNATSVNAIYVLE